MDVFIVVFIIYSILLCIFSFIIGGIIGIKWFSKQIHIVLNYHLTKIKQKIKNLKKLEMKNEKI